MITNALQGLLPVHSQRRCLRIIGIIDACEWAGLTPIDTPTLHMVAYLADALAPVWALEPMDGILIKQDLGPYYPDLQQDVDRLIGMGVVQVSNLRIFTDQRGEANFNAKYRLNHGFAQRILAALKEMPDEADVLGFLNEIAQAFSRLADKQMCGAMAEDATYGDPAIDSGEVIDLGDWVKASSTASAQAAQRINVLAGGTLEPPEMIDLYVGHIIRRVNRANA